MTKIIPLLLFCLSFFGFAGEPTLIFDIEEVREAGSLSGSAQRNTIRAFQLSDQNFQLVFFENGKKTKLENIARRDLLLLERRLSDFVVKARKSKSSKVIKGPACPYHLNIALKRVKDRKIEICSESIEPYIEYQRILNER